MTEIWTPPIISAGKVPQVIPGKSHGQEIEGDFPLDQIVIDQLESLRANDRSGGEGIVIVMEGESGYVASSFGTEFDDAIVESFEVKELDVLEGLKDGFGFVVNALAGCQQASDVNSMVVPSMWATASEFVRRATSR
ncbi:MAG: hypothetical protein Q9212_006562 [Teloschistes hypoglaucus]